MDAEDRSLIAWTLGSALAFGAIFVGVSAARASGSGTSLADVWQPLAALGVIGATVGALLGPLLRNVARRFRGP